MMPDESAYIKSEMLMEIRMHQSTLKEIERLTESIEANTRFVLELTKRLEQRAATIEDLQKRLADISTVEESQ
jgi:hypothetical protein